MQKLKVENPYHDGLTKIPEGIGFDFNQGGGFLKIVFDCPLDSEIKEMMEGKIKLGLLEDEGIDILFYKIR